MGLQTRLAWSRARQAVDARIGELSEGTGAQGTWTYDTADGERVSITRNPDQGTTQVMVFEGVEPSPGREDFGYMHKVTYTLPPPDHPRTALRERYSVTRSWSETDHHRSGAWLPNKAGEHQSIRFVPSAAEISRLADGRLTQGRMSDRNVALEYLKLRRVDDTFTKLRPDLPGRNGWNALKAQEAAGRLPRSREQPDARPAAASPAHRGWIRLGRVVSVGAVVAVTAGVLLHHGSRNSPEPAPVQPPSGTGESFAPTPAQDDAMLAGLKGAGPAGLTVSELHDQLGMTPQVVQGVATNLYLNGAVTFNGHEASTSPSFIRIPPASTVVAITTEGVAITQGQDFVAPHPANAQGLTPLDRRILRTVMHLQGRPGGCKAGDVEQGARVTPDQFQSELQRLGGLLVATAPKLPKGVKLNPDNPIPRKYQLSFKVSRQALNWLNELGRGPTAANRHPNGQAVGHGTVTGPTTKSIS